MFKFVSLIALLSLRPVAHAEAYLFFEAGPTSPAAVANDPSPDYSTTLSQWIYLPPDQLGTSYFDVGNATSDQPLERTIAIVNSGDSAANNMAPHPLAAPFAFKGGAYPGEGGTCGSVLAARTGCTIVVTFEPSQPNFTGSLLWVNYEDNGQTRTRLLVVSGRGEKEKAAETPAETETPATAPETPTTDEAPAKDETPAPTPETPATDEAPATAPETPAPAPETPAPAPETPAPAPETPAPAPETPAPAPEAPAPAPETPAPAPETPAPAPEAPAPAPETPAPAPETPAPAPETPAPTPETPAPAPEAPAPAPETPAPAPETPAPAPEAPVPTPETPAPAPETPAPETPAPAPETPAPAPEAPAVQTYNVEDVHRMSRDIGHELDVQPADPSILKRVGDLFSDIKNLLMAPAQTQP